MSEAINIGGKYYLATIGKYSSYLRPVVSLQLYLEFLQKFSLFLCVFRMGMRAI